MNKTLGSLYTLYLNNKAIPLEDRKINDTLMYMFNNQHVDKTYRYLLKFKRDKTWIGCIHDPKFDFTKVRVDIQKVASFLKLKYG